MSEKTSDETADEFSAFLGWMAVVAMLTFVALGAVYFWNFHRQPISGSPEAWGQFGDFFGGTINPLFGMFSLLVLMFSLQVQRATLKETRKQGVLAELQRLLAAVSRDIDAAMQVSMERTEGYLWGLVTVEGAWGVPHDIKRDVPVAEGMRYLWRRMIHNRFSHSSFGYLAASSEAEAVFRGLLRLDDCLVEFGARGGDAVIGSLYGKAYGDAARILATLHDLKVQLDLDAAYGLDALDRLGLQGHDKQVALIRGHYAALQIEEDERQRKRQEEIRKLRGESS